MYIPEQTDLQKKNTNIYVYYQKHLENFLCFFSKQTDRWYDGFYFRTSKLYA